MAYENMMARADSLQLDETKQVTIYYKSEGFMVKPVKGKKVSLKFLQAHLAGKTESSEEFDLSVFEEALQERKIYESTVGREGREHATIGALEAYNAAPKKQRKISLEPYEG